MLVVAQDVVLHLAAYPDPAAVVAVAEAETVLADEAVAADVGVAVAADFVAHAVDDNYYDDNAAYPDPNPAAAVAEAETDAIVAVVDVGVYVFVDASVDAAAAAAAVVSAVDDNDDAAFETDDLDADVHGVDYCFFCEMVDDEA